MDLHFFLRKGRMKKIQQWRARMKRCIIITAYLKKTIRQSLRLHEDDFIICADGGYELAKKEGIVPHVVIGDFDSGKIPEEESGTVIHVPCEKDDTDTLLCLKYGMEKGFHVFGIVGGIGGRLDHTFANLQALSYGCDLGNYVVLLNGDNVVTMLNPGTIQIRKREKYKLSLFSYTEYCKNVTIKGVKYPLKDALLDHSFPIGISNEILKEEATLSFEKGKLIVMFSRDAEIKKE